MTSQRSRANEFDAQHHWHLCESCGKRGYDTRRAAKDVLRFMLRSSGGKRMQYSVYTCRDNPDIFHVGHNTRSEAS